MMDPNKNTTKTGKKKGKKPQHTHKITHTHTYIYFFNVGRGCVSKNQNQVIQSNEKQTAHI